MSHLYLTDRFDYFIADSNELYKSNFGVIKNSYGKTIFDTSYSEEAFKKIYDTENEQCLIISHIHMDHYLGGKSHLKNFKKIYCSKKVAKEIIYMGCEKKQIHILHDEKNITVNNNIVSGLKDCHSDLDILMYNQEIGIAFLGDILLADRHPSLYKYSIDKIVDILNNLINLGIELFIPGHGKAMTIEDVKVYIKYLNYINYAQENNCTRQEVVIWLEKENIHWKYIDRLWSFLNI